MSSQGEIILAALQRGEVLTTLDIFKLSGSMAGHSRINDIRRMGYDVECKLRMRGSRKIWEYRMVWPVQQTLFGQCSAAIESILDETPHA